MDVSLIALLGFNLIFAALLYYFIFIRREQRLGPWAKSGLFAILFIILPLLVMTLWYQAGAAQRLHQLGFTPYPGLISSSGTATGTGESPLWVFSFKGNSDALLQFYKDKNNHKGWTLVSETATGLSFKRGGKMLSVFVSEDNVVFTVKPKKPNNS